MAGLCPVLSTHDENVPVWRVENMFELLPNTFERTVGTVVSVSCFDNLERVGSETFECLSSLQWSYSSKPRCQVPEADEGLDNDTKIIIGVVAGLAALIVAILIIIMCCVWRRDRKRRRLPGYGYGRDRYRSDIGLDDYSRRPPPSYASDPRMSERKYGSDDGRSRRSGPMYLPSRGPNYEDYYAQIKRSRNDDSYSDKKRPYTRDWVARSQRDMREEEYYDRASVHGRSMNGDTHLWRY